MPHSPNPEAQSPSAESENPGGFVHRPALDGIRGTAILLVLFHHLFWSNGNTGMRLFDLLSEVRQSSYVGVNLFFALSGYLITGILLDTLTTTHYFRTFYARRALRIFPLYYGSLLVLLLLTRPLHFEWSGWQYLYLTYVSNLFCWRANAPLNLGTFSINHYWSLQVEEQFYLVWPLVLYHFRRLESVVRISLVVCAVVFGVRVFLAVMSGHPGFTNPYLVYSPTFSCVDNILYGCCLCALLRTSARAMVLRNAPRLLVAVAALLLAAGIGNHGLDWLGGSSSALLFLIPTLGFSLVGIGCACVIAMALRKGSRTEGLFENRLLRFFGKYSYGIYVYHMSLAGLLQAPMRAWLNAHLHSRALGVLLEAGATAGLTVGLALVSYHLYEVKFLRLKRYFSYSRNPSRIA